MRLVKMAVKVYHRSGWKGLAKRITDYFYWNGKALFLFLFLRQGDVLFVSGCPGGSRFYRCENQAEKIRRCGLKVKIVDQNNPLLFFLVDKFKIFIFQRVIYSSQIARVVEKIKQQKKEIIFETDDLVFNPDYLPFMAYFSRMSEEEKGWYRNGIGREILEDKQVKRCLVSTNYLAEKIKEKYPDKEVIVSYNTLSAKQVVWAEKALRKKKIIQLQDGKVRLGYFSGSASHDADFASISDVILTLLKKRKNLVLRIVGPLQLENKFLVVEKQIEQLGSVPLAKLPELILQCDINLAPLEIDNPFCQAKSAIKFLEAGILGVPTVATATDSFCRVIKNGQTGFCVEDSAEWEKILERLIEDADLRKKIGQAARHSVKRDWTGGKLCL